MGGDFSNISLLNQNLRDKTFCSDMRAYDPCSTEFVLLIVKSLPFSHAFSIKIRWSLIVGRMLTAQWLHVTTVPTSEELPIIKSIFDRLLQNIHSAIFLSDTSALTNFYSYRESVVGSVIQATGTVEF